MLMTPKSFSNLTLFFPELLTCMLNCLLSNSNLISPWELKLSMAKIDFNLLSLPSI